MFSNNVVYGAAHVAYASEFADALEARGGHFRPGSEITTTVDAVTPAEHDPIIRPLLAKIDRALGAPLFDIFTAGGIPEDKQEDALGDLLLGVRGHGVSIEDKYGEQWERGCEACGVTAPLPYDEMTAYNDLAQEKLDAAGYPPEPEDGEKPDPSYQPIIATAFAWHGGQSSALYAFASTRTMQSETHKSNLLAEIRRCLATEEGFAEQASNDKLAELQAWIANLKRLQAAVEKAAPGTTFFYV